LELNRGLSGVWVSHQCQWQFRVGKDWEEASQSAALRFGIVVWLEASKNVMVAEQERSWTWRIWGSNRLPNILWLTYTLLSYVVFKLKKLICSI
jgi:hypothetical protein